MANDDDLRQPNNRFANDDSRQIDLNNPSEVLYWMKYLEISEPALRAAVGAVGHEAQAVKEHLRQGANRESTG